MKGFGTRDLRHANLPDRNDVFISPPTSPTRATTDLPTSPPRTTINLPAPSLPPRPSPSPSPAIKHTTGTNGNTRAPPLPVRRTMTGVSGNGPFGSDRISTPPASFLKPTRALSPIRGERNGAISPTIANTPQEADEDAEENKNPDQPGLVAAPAFDDADDPPAPARLFTSTHTGRSGVGNLPRTVPLSPTKLAHANSTPSSVATPPLTHRSNSSTSSMSTPIPLMPNSTGTRYGAALGGRIGAPVVKTPTGGYGGFGGNPVCSKCQKTVYFAEQVLSHCTFLLS